MKTSVQWERHTLIADTPSKTDPTWCIRSEKGSMPGPPWEDEDETQAQKRIISYLNRWPSMARRELKLSGPG